MSTMNEQLFTAALGLSAPWHCTNIEFSKTMSRLDITIDFTRGAKFACPECEAADCPVHDTAQKQWRHLDFFQHTCYLHARVPRIQCDTCGVRLVDVPWSRRGSGFTLLFEGLVMMLVEQMPFAAVARQVAEHDTRLWRIVEHYVNKARSQEDYSEVTTIGIDETSRRRGHNYVTIVADTKGKRVLFATKGKDKSTIKRFAADFANHGGNPKAVSNVCIDMSKAFINATEEYLPNAALTFDRFHVMKLANEALDKVRREDVKEHEYLKKTRYLWLRRKENLREDQAESLKKLLQINVKTARAYNYVLDLRSFYEMRTGYAEEYLRTWYRSAIHSHLESIRELAGTIKRHWDGVVRFHETQQTTGFMEGLNSIIQAAKRKARGYRNPDKLILIIYLIAGKLEFDLPT